MSTLNMTMSTSITANHSFEGLKIIVPPSECADAAEKLVPALLESWNFKYWLADGFTYRYGTPDFDGIAPEGVGVISFDRSDSLWTDRKGLVILASFLHADWTDIVGSDSYGEREALLPDLVNSEFVMLSCIDSAHWLCLSSDKNALPEFAGKIPYVSQKIVVDMERRSDWGL